MDDLGSEQVRLRAMPSSVATVRLELSHDLAQLFAPCASAMHFFRINSSSTERRNLKPRHITESRYLNKISAFGGQNHGDDLTT